MTVGNINSYAAEEEEKKKTSNIHSEDSCTSEHALLCNQDFTPERFS